MYYDGDSKKSIDNVKTQQDCTNKCETDDNCYGWAYQASSKTCTLQNSIGWKTTDASYVGGSCIGKFTTRDVSRFNFDSA